MKRAMPICIMILLTGCAYHQAYRYYVNETYQRKYAIGSHVACVDFTTRYAAQVSRSPYVARIAGVSD